MYINKNTELNHMMKMISRLSSTSAVNSMGLRDKKAIWRIFVSLIASRLPTEHHSVPFGFYNIKLSIPLQKLESGVPRAEAISASGFRALE